MEVNIYININFRGKLAHGTGTCCIALEYITSKGPAVREIYKEISNTTKNRTTLIACIIALNHLTKPCFVNLYIDNTYATEPINQDWVTGWKERGKKNTELWEILLSKLSKHKVRMSFEEINPYTSYMQTQLRRINPSVMEDRKEPYEFI